MHTFIFIMLRLRGEGWANNEEMTENSFRKFNMTKDGMGARRGMGDCLCYFTRLPVFNNHFYDNEKHFWELYSVCIFSSAHRLIKNLFQSKDFLNASLNSYKGTQKLFFSPLFVIFHINPQLFAISKHYVCQVVCACVSTMIKRAFYAEILCVASSNSFATLFAIFTFPLHMHFCFLCALSNAHVYVTIMIILCERIYRVMQFNDEMQWRGSYLRWRISDFSY